MNLNFADKGKLDGKIDVLKVFDSYQLKKKVNIYIVLKNRFKTALNL